MATEAITRQDARKFLIELFARACMPDKIYRNKEEQLQYLSKNGAQHFKRKALGLCGSSAIKSLDEFAELLTSTNIANSLEEAKELVPKIVQASKTDRYAISRMGNKFKNYMILPRYMTFSEVRNLPGEIKYKITAWTEDSC